MPHDVLDEAKAWVAAGHSTSVLIPNLITEVARLRALVMLGDFSGLRPNSDSFKLVQQIRRERSTGEQALHPEEKR